MPQLCSLSITVAASRLRARCVAPSAHAAHAVVAVHAMPVMPLALACAMGITRGAVQESTDG